MLDQGDRRIAKCPARVDDIVDQDAAPAVHVADNVHNLGNAGPLAPLINDGEVGVNPLGVIGS